ncbi:MAG: hypothetical protein OXH53_15380 [bacterium]|nr:hypothetical protein [bacterium]MCY3633486.1 hypothetical protein [bacterium]
MSADHTTHPDDEFHPPTSDDPYWTETCWFTFAAPEHKLSGQLYPFFRPNQGVTSGGAFFWDTGGDQIWNCRYAKNFWHLPLPDQPLSDIELPNGIRYQVIEPLKQYRIGFLCQDDGEAEVDLTFTAVCPPNYLGDGHLDQPGRYQGTIRLGEDTYEVDAYGMRDRSWGPRSQFGATLHGAVRGGYSYATASGTDGFHALTMAYGEGDDPDCTVIHGYYLRDGEYSRLVPGQGRRDVIERDPDTGAPTAVRIEAVDESGREMVATSRAVNRIGVHLNPNLWTWNCLSEWTFGDAIGWGEDHDNWSAAGYRRFVRGHLGLD